MEELRDQMGIDKRPKQGLLENQLLTFGRDLTKIKSPLDLLEPGASPVGGLP